MKLSLCRCEPDLLQRVPRTWWMRVLFPRKRLYYCRFCRQTMLTAPVLHVADTQPRPHAGSAAQPH